MSEPGFTPGPWSLETHHRFGHDRMVETWYVQAPNRVGIAVQPAFSDDTNAEANARLIAAAPALYEALEPFAKAAEIKLCGEWADDKHFGQTDVGFYLTFGDLRKALAALSLALGEKP